MLAATLGRADRVDRGKLAGADDIGVAVGKVLNKHKVGKHIDYQITDTSFTYRRKQSAIDSEAALDGIYVLRTSVAEDRLDPAGVVASYKNLAHLERDFRSIKVDDLDLRPIRHRLADRVKAHVLLCMLANYLLWRLRQVWEPLTFTDEHPPERADPVAPPRAPSTPEPRHPGNTTRPASPTAASVTSSHTSRP